MDFKFLLNIFLFILRCLEVGFSVITFACIVGGYDVCLQSTTLHEILRCQHYDSSYYTKVDQLGGQIFILFFIVVFILTTTALTVISIFFKDYRRIILEIINASVATVLHLICFCVEVWYSQGYGKLENNYATPIKSFAAAAAFLFFNICTCAADAIFTWWKAE